MPPSRTASWSGSISGATPRSSVETPTTSAESNASPSSRQHSSSSSHQTGVDAHKKSQPEDIYELLCNDTVLPLSMTLASIRHYVWRSSAELLLFYRRK
jgi:WD repeat-containing protein 48